MQACHAAVEAARYFGLPRDTPHLVLCGVKDEAKLKELVTLLMDSPVRYYAYREPDNDHQLTAVATELVYGEARKMFRKYQLLK